MGLIDRTTPRIEAGVLHLSTHGGEVERFASVQKLGLAAQVYSTPSPERDAVYVAWNDAGSSTINLATDAGDQGQGNLHCDDAGCQQGTDLPRADDSQMPRPSPSARLQSSLRPRRSDPAPPPSAPRQQRWPLLVRRRSRCLASNSLERGSRPASHPSSSLRRDDGPQIPWKVDGHSHTRGRAQAISPQGISSIWNRIGIAYPLDV